MCHWQFVNCDPIAHSPDYNGDERLIIIRTIDTDTCTNKYTFDQTHGSAADEQHSLD